MNEPSASPLTPFAWVTKRDGRLVPFEADKICRALFAATESLGHPDAFAARELTDVILHFLAAEADAATPTTAQVADLVVKVVRELGQTALAKAFADGAATAAIAPAARAPEASSVEQLDQWVEGGSAPVSLVWRAGGACLRAYALRHVFTRDLVAAHETGLITLTGLEAPLELAACVLDPHAVGSGPWAVDERLIEAMDEARHAAGVFLAIDSPEYGLAHCPQTPVEYARDLHIGLRANGLPGVLNLNCATPPVWADELAEGPLFADYRQAPTPGHLAEIADTLLEELALRHRRYAASRRRPAASPGFAAPVRIDWHLGSRDFSPESAGRLARVARWAAEEAPVTFVFDRARGSVALAEGLDRKHTALLLTVGLHLPRLAELLPAPADPDLFLQKLGSLARLALSAAARKREFLRQRVPGRPALARGFLLERARLLIAPIGLEPAVRKLCGVGLCAGGAGLELARRIVQRLQAILVQDGPACQLEACLDGPAAFHPEGEQSSDIPAGLTPWDAAADPEDQLRAADTLHAAAGTGTAAVLLPAEGTPSPDALVSALRFAWTRSEVVRVRFVRPAPRPARHATPWAAELAAV